MRKISDNTITLEIVGDLKNGVLSDLLTAVKRDDTLEIEFREGYINIYYRGGSASKITKIGGHIYQDFFNEKYSNDNSLIDENDEKNGLDVGIKVATKSDCCNLVDKIYIRKRIMDNWFASHPKSEREYQQLIERENNNNSRSNYYICDVEYTNQKETVNSRFDMVGLHRTDNSDYKKLKLVVIEVKYGDGAVSGNCGIYEHYCDMLKLSKQDLSDIKEETKTIFNYKKDLGLIKVLNYVEHGVGVDDKDDFMLDLIYFVGGFAKKYNSKLLSEFKKIQKTINNGDIKINVKIFKPYLAGYLMFDGEVITIDEFLKLNN